MSYGTDINDAIRSQLGVHTGRIGPRIKMPPPGKLEVFLFWAVGIVVMILSGAVAIYASHLHLWEMHQQAAEKRL